MLELKVKTYPNRIKLEKESYKKSSSMKVDAAQINIKARRAAAGHINHNDIYMFTRQLANLLKAGMEIPVALEILGDQTSRSGMRSLIKQIAKSVNEGKSLADAICLYPDIFSDMYINVVHSAQNGGELDMALQYIADLLERRKQLKSQINRALAYPVLIIAVSIMVIIFLLSAVIPNISNLFLETGRQLPFITRSLIFVSNMTGIILPFAFAAIAVAYVYLKYYLRSYVNQQRWDHRKLKMPLVGKFLLQAETSRLCRSLCAMLKGGLSIVESLRLATGTVNNKYIRESIRKITDGLNKGMSVEESFRKYGHFQPMIHHAIAIGESTGELEKQLSSMADIIDEEINNTTTLLTTMLEPVIMLVMGVVTGYIVAAMLLPIFEINNIL